jgi:hypothetical protein
MGNPCDHDGQLAVLRAALEAAAAIKIPGETVHLPFEWQEPLRAAESSHPAPPITKHIIRHPMELRKLLARKIPDTGSH